jgi:hypothetical protein
VSMRIQRSRATVKALHSRLQDAYRRDDMRLVRRTTVLIDLLVHCVPVAVLCERWGLSPACHFQNYLTFLRNYLSSSDLVRKLGFPQFWNKKRRSVGSICATSLDMVHVPPYAIRPWRPGPFLQAQSHWSSFRRHGGIVDLGVSWPAQWGKSTCRRG